MKTLKILVAISTVFYLNTRAQEIDILNSKSPSYAHLGKNKIKINPDSAQQNNQEQEENSDAQRVRKVSKSFNLDKDDKVVIDNQYGEIVLKTWNKNEVKVDVDINVYSNSESDAQKLIDGVSIDGNKSGNEVVFRTSIANRNGNFGSVIRNGIVKKRREMKINYVIYMPANNAVQLTQKYGNINIESFNGPTAIRIQYGSLKADALNNSNNYINVEYGKTEVGAINGAVIKHNYGSGVNIGEANTLDIDASYVGINIGTIKKSIKISQEYGSGINITNVFENLTIDAQYAKINLGTVKGVSKIRSDYGNINATRLNTARINTSYATLNVSELLGDANIKMSYNSLSIKNIAQTCRSLVFEGEYANVNLGFANQFGGDFVVDTSYGNFNSSDNITSKLTSKSNTSKEFRGKIGNGGSSNVSVISTYASVNFK